MVRGAGMAIMMLFRAWDERSETVRSCPVAGIQPHCRYLSMLKWLSSDPCDIRLIALLSSGNCEFSFPNLYQSPHGSWPRTLGSEVRCPGTLL